MGVNLSIKGVPETWAERLRLRAQHNHRSLQGELMAIIEQAASEPAGAARAAPVPAAASARVTGADRRGQPIRKRAGKSIEQIAAELRALYPEPVTDAPRSVDIVRELRDGR